MSAPLLEPADRLTKDDQATRLDELQLAAALRQHQAAALRAPARRPGVCTNCGAACLPSAVYCDADCREDHETREATQARLAGRR